MRDGWQASGVMPAASALPVSREVCVATLRACTLDGVTPSTLLADPRPAARVALLRWLLVSLVLTGVIAMHVLSRHDAGGGHHGSMIDEPATAMSGPGAHAGHDAAEMAAPATVGNPVLLPALPAGGGDSMAACILFLVVGAGAALLALRAAFGRRGIETLSARSRASLPAAIPRGPPPVGPPRITLCVLRV